MSPRRRLKPQAQPQRGEPLQPHSPGTNGWWAWSWLFSGFRPLYWGHGVPHGDGSAVVLVPGFLGTDLYLTQFRNGLRRIGYEPFYSGIHMNADCPNLLNPATCERVDREGL